MLVAEMDVTDPELRSWVREVADAVGFTLGNSGGCCRIVDVAALGPAANGVSDPRKSAKPPSRDRIVVGRRDDSDALIRAAQLGASEIVLFPGGGPHLEQFLRAHQPDPHGAQTGRVFTVTGARGGAGATSFAAGLAVAAARDGSCVLVDADPASAGIDDAVGLDSVAGIRWSDMVDVRGDLPATMFRGRIPHVAGVDWLATPMGTGNVPSWMAVMTSLVAAYDTVVVDLPRYRLAATPAFRASVSIIVATLEMSALSATRDLLSSGRFGVHPTVAVRPVGGPLRMAAAVDAIDSTRLVEIPNSRSLRGSADFGDLATSTAKGSFAKACRHVVDQGVD